MIRLQAVRLLIVIGSVFMFGMARAERIVSVSVEGTQFQVALDSGQVLDSKALSGAVLDILVPGGKSQHIRITDVVRDADDPDGDVFLHRILVADAVGHWVELCEADSRGMRAAFPLRGQWDSEGKGTSDHEFILTCTSGAQGKCVRFGYKPWKTRPDGSSLASYHAACVKAVRADYCGDHATTREGQLIDIYDQLGIQRRDNTRAADALRFEAGFSPSGAVCVAHTRVPEQMTLDALAASCPRLVGRLGEAACSEDDTVAGRHGASIIFIRSPTEGRNEPPRLDTSEGRPAGLSGWPRLKLE